MESEKTKAKILKTRADIAIRDRPVSMSNALARGAQGLNLSKKRIIAMAMAGTDSLPAKDLLQGQMHGWTIRLNAHDYAETYEVDINTAYEQLKAGADGLLRTLWETVEIGAKKGKIRTKGQWLSLAKYHDKAGYVDITFHPYVAPHLLMLRSHFTTYKLKQASALRSIYAWRLFECLQSWKDKGKWTPTIEEFHKAMEAPPSCLKNYKDLRKRIIEPALKELQDKDGLDIEWKPVKAGRKVTGLEFTFQPQSKQKRLFDV
jgi:plasmid replication initiation protein